MCKHDFEIGDLVVLSQFSGDFAKAHDDIFQIFDFENDLKTLALLSGRNDIEVRSSSEHLRHATLEEFKLNHRIDNKGENT